MKSYEILPANMMGSGLSGGAKTPKAYEILPGAGAAEQGLGGWTKGVAAGTSGGGTGPSGSRLPYDPTGVVTGQSGKAGESMGKPHKAYELLPGAGTAMKGLGGKGRACGCGGKCGGSGKDVPGNLVPNPPATVQIDLLDLTSQMLGSLKNDLIEIAPGGSGPGARACWFLEAQIIGLREEIADRRRRFGPRIDEVSEAWRYARSSCQSPGGEDICHWLGEALAHFGDVNADVPRYNALGNMHRACTMNASASTLAVIQALACNMLTTDAIRRERDAVQAQPADDRVDYRYDIWPLEQAVIALESQYRRCLNAAMGVSPPGVAPLVECPNIGSTGCNRSTRLKTCTYGGCDDGGPGCPETIACGPGNWDPQCPSTSNCGRR